MGYQLNSIAMRTRLGNLPAGVTRLPRLSFRHWAAGHDDFTKSHCTSDDWYQSNGKDERECSCGFVSMGKLLYDMHPLLCFLLNFINGNNGNGINNSTTSVAILITADICMKSAPLMQPSGCRWMSQARVIGIQASSCA